MDQKDEFYVMFTSRCLVS